MKAKSLSTNILKNRVKQWAMHCHRDKNYTWTKHDANALLLLEREIKDRQHQEYLRQKAVEANPYLDPDQPYHTT